MEFYAYGWNFMHLGVNLSVRCFESGFGSASAKNGLIYAGFLINYRCASFFVRYVIETAFAVFDALIYTFGYVS